MNIRRIVKISVISLLSLVGIIIIGAALLVTFVNPNTFKPLIIKAVYESTDRKLAIDGDISWKLWPNIGLQIEKLSLSNPEGYTPANMLDVSKATVSVELMPLLARNVIIDNIIIDGLNVGLIKKGGSNNWTFKQTATSTSKSAANSKDTMANKPMKLELSKFILTHTTFSYNDMDKNKQYSIKDFAFNLEKEYGGQISVDPDNQKINLNKIKFDFDSIINGRLSFVANNFDKLTYQGDMDIDKFSVTKLTNKLNQPIAALKGKDLFNQVTIKTIFKGDLNSIVLNGFNFNFSDLVKGLLNVNVDNFSNPVYSGDVKLDELSANAVLDQMNIAVAARKDKPLLNKIALNTKFTGNVNSVNLQQLNFNFPGVLQGLANVKVQNFSAPAYTGDIKLNEFSANSVLDKMNIAVAARKENQLLNKVALSTNFAGNADSVNLQQLNFNFPGVLQGLTNVKVQNFSSPAYSGDIKLNEFSPNLVLDKMNIAVAARKGNQLLNKVAAFSTNFAGNADSVNLQQLNFNFPGILQGLLNLKVQNFVKPTYTGNIDLPTFSLNGLMAKLAMAPIDIPNKQLLNKVSLKTNFTATSNSVNLTNLSSQISDSILSGSINIPSIKPLSISENIRMSKLNVEDFTDTNGYKVPLSGIAANGSFTNNGADFKNMAGVSANQNVMVDNVTVLGIDLNNLFTQFDGAVSSTGKAVELSNLQSIAHSARAIGLVQNMRDIAARAKSSGAKNYNEKTNFGMLQSNLVMHNGVANPSSFKLSGPTIKGDGKGSVNMVDKSLNYNIAVQIVTPQKNPLLNKIIFPYQVHGKFSNLEGGVDWMSIQKQILPLLVNEAVSQTKAIATDQVNKQIDNLTKGAAPQVQQNVDNIKKGAANLINNIFK